MAFKFIIFATLLAMTRAGNILTGPPLAYASPALAKHIDEPYNSNPQYNYAYDVQDSLTGDNKQQQESRNGDLVQGSYSFIEADGSRRIVEYTADPLNGFNAVVRRESAAAPAPIIAKTPLAHAAPAPLAYTHPASAFAYAAQPIAKNANTIYH